MKVEMRDLRDGPYELEVNSPPAELELEDPEFRFDSPVTGKIRFQLVNQKVIAKGMVQTRVGTECVRCLSPTTARVQAPVDAIYEKDEELLKPENQAFGHADQQISYFNGEFVDPAPEVREALLLELPTLPLCSQDCKGLCPQCGVSWNEQECSCGKSRDEHGDWKAALKDIKLK